MVEAPAPRPSRSSPHPPQSASSVASKKRPSCGWSTPTARCRRRPGGVADRILCGWWGERGRETKRKMREMGGCLGGGRGRCALSAALSLSLSAPSLSHQVPSMSMNGDTCRHLATLSPAGSNRKATRAPQGVFVTTATPKAGGVVGSGAGGGAGGLCLLLLLFPLPPPTRSTRRWGSGSSRPRAGWSGPRQAGAGRSSGLPLHHPPPPRPPPGRRRPSGDRSPRPRTPTRSVGCPG